MGKNQGHKQMQKGRHPGGEEGAAEIPSEEGADVSFHTPAWHAARLAALTVERVPYEDWKKQRKDEEAARQALAVDEEKQMRDYRAQLDADRAQRLSHGTNHTKSLGVKDAVRKQKSDSKKQKHKKDKKEKKLKKSKKRQRESPSSSSDSSGGRSHAQAAASGPVRLSDFLKQ